MLRARCFLLVCVLVLSCGGDPSVPGDSILLVEYVAAGGIAPTFRKMTIDKKGLARKVDQTNETIDTLSLASSELDLLDVLLKPFASFDSEYGQVNPDGIGISITAWPNGARTTVSILGFPYDAIPLKLNQLMTMLGQVYSRFDGGV